MCLIQGSLFYISPVLGGGGWVRWPLSLYRSLSRFETSTRICDGKVDCADGADEASKPFYIRDASATYLPDAVNPNQSGISADSIGVACAISPTDVSSS